MRSFFRPLMVLAALGTSASAQPKPPASVEGVLPAWDIRSTFQAIASHAARVLPILDQVDAQSWIAKGAPDTYAAQLKTARVQFQAISTTAAALAKSPEKLSADLELLLRINATENLTRSLCDGVRKYQNPALAELITGVVAENGANRERLQKYVVDLAAEREQEYTIMDREAQRCRGMLSRGAPTPTRK